MQEKGICSPAEQDAQIDRAIMALLLDRYHGLLKVEGVARDIGDETAVEDSLARLHGAGLINRYKPFGGAPDLPGQPLFGVLLD